MMASSAHRTPGEDLRARRPVTGKAGAPGDRVDGVSLTVNELVRARYRYHLDTGFVPELAVLLAEWDVAGYLGVTGAGRTDRRDAR
jgi:hypothetical protein